MVFFILIALVAILAASNSFFVARTYQLSRASKPSASISPKINENAESSATPAAASSSQVSKPAASAEKPSKPADTYTIQKGETLFSIAQAQGTSWQDLADANGISDVNKIQAGQILIVPKGGQVNFTIDNTRATSLQKDADAGKFQFRLSPEDTARSDAPTVYNLAVDDTYTLKKPPENGAAEVQATHESKNFLIKLSQPVTKGEKGIWAIESIRPV